MGRKCHGLLALFVVAAGCDATGGHHHEGGGAGPGEAGASGGPSRTGGSTGAANHGEHAGGMTASHGGHTGATPAPDNQAQPAASLPWSDPRLWGGKLPGPDSNVTIPAGTRVTLDQNVCVRGLTIEGELRFADKDLELCARWIMVHGLLEVGTEARPFAHKATITLVGSDQKEDVGGMGTKVIGVMGKGRLELHGAAPARSWTQLARPAKAGDDSIEVLDATGWQMGEEIAIASGTAEPDEAETRLIAGKTGNTLRLDRPLKFARPGGQTMIDGRVLDTRAEVALLTRRIVIRGDEGSAAAGNFGGQIMIMVGGQAHVEGIEMVRMGQFNHLGRYPFHWHIVGNAQGQYIKRSVVSRSFQRGIVVHATRNVLVEDNVVHDSMGHNFIIETPDTVDNVLRGNLAMGNRLARHTLPALVEQHDHAPANYWFRSARNTFVGNVAAGSTANGFWYDQTSDGPTTFSKNVVHSSAGRGTGFDFKRDSGLLVQNPESMKEPLVFSDSTFYANLISLWPSEAAQVYERLVIAGGGDAVLVTAEAVGAKVVFTDTLFVGKLPHENKPPATAVLIQYGADVELRNPVFAAFGKTTLFFSNDINVPWMARYQITGARFVDTDRAAATVPPDHSLLSSMDDGFLPRGFYVPAAERPLHVPGMTMTTLGGAGETATFLVGPQEARYAELHAPFRASTDEILRSDGLRYAEPDRAGFRVVTDSALSYRFTKVPAQGVLSFHLETHVGALAGDPSVLVQLPLAAAPRRVRRLERGSADADEAVFSDVPSAVSLEAMASGYHYDAGQKMLSVRVGTKPVQIER